MKTKPLTREQFHHGLLAEGIMLVSIVAEMSEWARVCFFVLAVFVFHQVDWCNCNHDDAGR